MEAFKIKVKKEEKLINVISSVTKSKRKAKKFIDEGLVCVNGRKELFYRKQIKRNSIVEFCLNPELFTSAKPQILFQEKGIFVFDKPPFMNSNVNKPNIEEIVSKELKKKVKVIHRLDKQTSGLILATESNKIFNEFKELFKKKLIEKEYLAIVVGVPKKNLKISHPLDGKEAVTKITVVEKFKDGSLCKILIPTGRKHQIRRHLSMIGFPVAGEFKYWKNYKFPFTVAPRILLHSFKLTFPLPNSSKKVTVESKIPEDFLWFANGLKKGFKIREVEFPPTSQEI